MTDDRAGGSPRDRRAGLSDPFASGKKPRPRPGQMAGPPGAESASTPPTPPEEAAEPRQAEAAEPTVEPEAVADDAAAEEGELVLDDPGSPSFVVDEGPDIELSDADFELLADASRDLVAEYKDRAARAEAELANFRRRVERDRQANREAVVAEVIRSLLPAIDDLDRAEAHGDLEEGSPLAIVAQKLRAAFERHGLERIGRKGEPFDPNLHEALMQFASPDATAETVADVIEPGYRLGERLIRAAKVAVHVPE